jgi:hypothetical protein
MTLSPEQIEAWLSGLLIEYKHSPPAQAQIRALCDLALKGLQVEAMRGELKLLQCANEAASFEQGLAERAGEIEAMREAIKRAVVSEDIQVMARRYLEIGELGSDHVAYTLAHEILRLAELEQALKMNEVGK